MTESLTADLTPELFAWVSKASGATPIKAQRLFGGGSRHTMLVDAEQADGSILPLVLRLEGEGAHSGTSFSLEREFVVYRALAGRGVPVPKAYGLMDGGQALLLERLEGTGEFRRMPEEVQPVVAERFMEALGHLHATHARDLSLPGFEIPQNGVEHATVDLGRWEALAREHCWDLPLLRYAFSRLRAQAPQHVQRTVLVQGDTGPGNFMALPDRITGLIDWEFSHVGDPMDDFGWLKNRTGEKYPLFAAAFPLYEEISGIKVDAAGMDYYNRMAVLRCAVTVGMAISRGGALGVIPYRVALQDYLNRLADMLVQEAGVQVSPDAAPSSSIKTNPLYEEGLAELHNHVTGAVRDRRVRIAAHAAISALTSLQLRERFGAELEARDQADRRALFGAGEQVSLSDEADKAGAAGDTEMLKYLARRTWRERLMWPPSRR